MSGIELPPTVPAACSLLVRTAGAKEALCYWRVAATLAQHPPGMYATTLFPLLSWTLATLRLALLGFLGAMVDTWEGRMRTWRIVLAR
jgi:hypothetical protein